MDSFELFKMIFYALDNQYDLNPSEELGNVLSSMNPFLFEGIGSAVPDLYVGFKEIFDKRFNGKCSIEEGYDFAKEYIASLKNNFVEDAFNKVTLDDWIEASTK